MLFPKFDKIPEIINFLQDTKYSHLFSNHFDDINENSFDDIFTKEELAKLILKIRSYPVGLFYEIRITKGRYWLREVMGQYYKSKEIFALENPEYSKITDVLSFDDLNDFDNYLVVNNLEFFGDCEKYGANICKVSKEQIIEKELENREFVVFGKAKPKFTAEQQKVIEYNSAQNLIVNAVAGSGKTTTLIEMANNLAQEGKKVLFTSFSKEIIREINRKLIANNYENAVAIAKEMIFEQTKYFSAKCVKSPNEIEQKFASNYANNQDSTTRKITNTELDLIKENYADYEDRFVNRFLYYYLADRNFEAIKYDSFMNLFYIGQKFVEDFDNRIAGIEPKNNTKNNGVYARGMHSMGLNMWLRHLNRNGEKFVHSSVDTSKSGSKNLQTFGNKYSRKIYKDGEYFKKLKEQILKESEIKSDPKYHSLEEILGDNELEGYLLSSEKDFNIAYFEQILFDKFRLNVKKKFNLIQTQVSNIEEKLDLIQTQILKNKQNLEIYKKNYDQLIPEDRVKLKKLSQKREELIGEKDLILEELDKVIESQHEANIEKDILISYQKTLTEFVYDSRKIIIVQAEVWRNITIELVSKLRLCKPAETLKFDVKNICEVAKGLIKQFQLDADLLNLSENILVDLVLPRIRESLLTGLSQSKEGILDFDDMLWLPVCFELKSKYKYDIVLVDEAQDMNELMYQVVTNCIAPNTQIVLVGDDKQAIYGFAGSTSGALTQYKNKLKATDLPMTTCFRCPPNVLAQVNSQFDTRLIAREGKENGIIGTGFADLQEDKDTLILARFNLPLYEIALKLRNAGLHVSIEKKDEVLELYKKIVENFGEDVAKGITVHKERARITIDNKINKIYSNKTAGYKTRKAHTDFLIAKLTDDLQVLGLLYNKFAQEPKNQIYSSSTFEIFYNKFISSSKNSPIRLMSIHKSKGLEAENVYILGTELIAGKVKFGDIELIKAGEIALPFDETAEENLKYVALTRTKQNLYLVN